MPDLESILALAAKFRARRVRVGDVEVELSDAAFAAPAPAGASDLGTPETELCACGHDLAIEHSETGCLRGCGVDSCLREPAAPPEEP